jgi:hypothetical protein
MFFKFKKKQPEVIAFIAESKASLLKTSPICLSKNHYPAWWKNIPSSSFDWDKLKVNNTVKACPGIINTLKRGLLLPMWSDGEIDIVKNGNYEFDDNTFINNTPGGFKSHYSDYLHLSISTPWLIRTDVKLLTMHPFYADVSLPNYLVKDSIIEAKKIIPIEFKIFISKDNNNPIVFKKNTPVLYFMPVGQEVNLRLEVISDQEFKKYAYF